MFNLSHAVTEHMVSQIHVAVLVLMDFIQVHEAKPVAARRYKDKYGPTTDLMTASTAPTCNEARTYLRHFFAHCNLENNKHFLSKLKNIGLVSSKLPFFPLPRLMGPPASSLSSAAVNTSHIPMPGAALKTGENGRGKYILRTPISPHLKKRDYHRNYRRSPNQ